MNAVVLIENTAPEGSALASEHGLALYLEYRGRQILLDAGSSGRFADNAAALGVDLSQVELAVLSHGHYDHADGLRRFFQINDHAPVYIRQGADGPMFSLDDRGVRYIGIHRDLLGQFPERFVPVTRKHLLMEGLWLTPCLRREPAFIGRASNLVYKRGEDDFLPDDFRHEQSLVAETDGGLVLFNSCSHAGIVNIVLDTLDQFPGQRVRAVVGGFHMVSPGGTGMNCSPEYVFSVADTLRDLGVEEIHTGHCTGGAALERMRRRFGRGCTALTTGQRLVL